MKRGRETLLLVFGVLSIIGVFLVSGAFDLGFRL